MLFSLLFFFSPSTLMCFCKLKKLEKSKIENLPWDIVEGLLGFGNNFHVGPIKTSMCHREWKGMEIEWEHMEGGHPTTLWAYKYLFIHYIFQHTIFSRSRVLLSFFPAFCSLLNCYLFTLFASSMQTLSNIF